VVVEVGLEGGEGDAVGDVEDAKDVRGWTLELGVVARRWW